MQRETVNRIHATAALFFFFFLFLTLTKQIGSGALQLCSTSANYSFFSGATDIKHLRTRVAATQERTTLKSGRTCAAST